MYSIIFIYVYQNNIDVDSIDFMLIIILHYYYIILYYYRLLMNFDPPAEIYIYCIDFKIIIILQGKHTIYNRQNTMVVWDPIRYQSNNV